MFTKEFIKISQILDHYGMHRQADDLLRIAQPKPPVPPKGKAIPKKPVTNQTAKTPVKPATTPAPVINVLPTKQDDIVKYFQNQLNRTKNPPKFEGMVTEIEKQYRNNLIDYKTYADLIRQVNVFYNENAQLIKQNDPSAFAPESQIMNTPIQGSNAQIQLATPVEGITAAGEKAFQNREDRNLPKLQKEWNEYLKTDSFKTSIQSRIDWLKKNEPGTDTTQLQELLDKANKKEGLQVGDFGNNGKASEVYGVEAKPLTSITGTPTTPGAGTATTATPATPVKHAPSR
jgi:hypothetical protein